MGSSFSVFISFRGEDTRTNFARNLYHALCFAGIETYIDENSIGKGAEISKSLVKTIKKSDLSLIIFSENYASSSWCLDELELILERKEKGQTVIPVFYGVDPLNVRKQKGSYAISTEQFDGRADKVLAWKAALTKAANLSGWDSRTTKPEPKLIGEIVEHVKMKMDEFDKIRRKYEIAAAGQLTLQAAAVGFLI